MTTNEQNLGRLERVELNAVWDTEASDFTPWLARNENIAVLGEAIDLELDVEAVEKNIGRFRADILCRDTTNDNFVLIENQLQRTDHTHLGQLLTYAAGLDAVTIVWIAKRFSEEHRAALDWLNEITSNRFNFFGLEVELWRIGDSPVAPKFNVVSKPNTITKRSSGTLSTPRPERYDYWTAFHEYLAEQAPEFKPGRVTDGASMDVGVGWKGLHFKVGGYDDHDHVFVRLVGRGEVRYQVIEALQEEKEDIEQEFGDTVFRSGKMKAPNLQANREGGRAESDKLEGDFEWYLMTMRKLKQILGPRISQIITSG